MGLGCREWMTPGLVDRPRGTDDWMVLILPDGGQIGVEGVLVTVATPTLIVWQPSAPHLYGDPTANWCHSWMHVAGQAVGRLVRLAGLPVDTLIGPADAKEVDRCILGLHQEISSDRPDPVIAECLLRILLQQIARRRLKAATILPAGLLAARRKLEEHFAEPISLASLALLAGLSPNHFCTIFRRAFGISPYDFALSLRLEHARVLLRDRSRSVAQVATAVGYDNPASFARLMRRRIGRSPRSLR